MPTQMVSPRDYTLRTLSGHVIFFPANQPVSVPDVAVSDALAVNILPVQTLQTSEPALRGPVSLPAISGTLRDALILSVIDVLVKENDSINFNAGGQPKLSVVNGLTGVRLSGGELTKYWDRYREIKSTNSPMPSHPQMHLVQELQAMTTRKQLVEFARDIQFPESEVTRVGSVKEAKERLLQAVLNYHPPVADTPAPGAPDLHTLVDQD